MAAASGGRALHFVIEGELYGIGNTGMEDIALTDMPNAYNFQRNKEGYNVMKQAPLARDGQT